ncbi:TetR/AcrR family transcriptional regulator [Abyssisolibacter fermentans]|uniref:TetR/AcrR family transcriptional regulator n=1 Tax=Abyssisolibacter fermentans TaxID=1766203 RepID=UPI00082AA4B8|nr:TetR/AcrR family transcriptional regulator [Abyssisolibacter fermentans]
MTRIIKTPQERKAEIITTARELFAENGIEKTKVSMIVKKIGVAQGLFYYYFKSKDYVINAVIDQVFTEMECKMDAIVNNKKRNFYQKLTDYVDLYFESIGQVGPQIIQEIDLLSNAKIYRHIEDDIRELNKRVVKQLMEIGTKEGIINLQYPNEMFLMILSGICEVAYRMTVSREMILKLVEQGLNLKIGSLTG